MRLSWSGRFPRAVYKALSEHTSFPTRLEVKSTVCSKLKVLLTCTTQHRLDILPHLCCISYPVVVVPSNTTTYTLTSLIGNTKYDVWVTATTTVGSTEGNSHSFTTLKYGEGFLFFKKGKKKLLIRPKIPALLKFPDFFFLIIIFLQRQERLNGSWLV